MKIAWHNIAKCKMSPVCGGFVKFVVCAMDPVPDAKPAIAGVKPVLRIET